MLKVADKHRLLAAAGFEPPKRRPGPFSGHWFVPRAFCPELGTTGIDEIATGKMLPFDEAWRRYEAKESI
jgi:hypothetical protein